MDEPLFVNGTYIVSANEWGKYVGVGTLSVVDGELVDFQWKAEEITSEKYPRDGEIATILVPFVRGSEAALKEVVLETTDEFIFGNKLSRKIELPLGNFVADAQVEYLAAHGVEVDFGFTNKCRTKNAHTNPKTWIRVGRVDLSKFNSCFCCFT